MQEIATLIAGGGSVGGIILGVMWTLQRSFGGITEQWATIFATQEKQIAELGKELTETRVQAALDRGRYDAEIATAKLAEKQCREDWIALSLEVRDLRRKFDQPAPAAVGPVAVTIEDGPVPVTIVEEGSNG